MRSVAIAAVALMSLALSIAAFAQWSNATLGGTMSVRISETKSMLVRIDTTNVLNHPTPNDPNLNINLSTTNPVDFGAITSKTGSRAFQGTVRLNF